MNNGNKRKRTQLDDSDDEEPAFGKQVLPVPQLPNNFDGVPTDGLQYLFMVRRDARTLPHVTRVHNPYDFEDEPPKPAFPMPSSGSVILMPSDEWRTIFMKRFRNFRKNSMQPTTRIDRPSGSTLGKRLPDKKDRDAWWAFLSGRPDAEWNPKKPKGPTAKQQRQQKYGNGRGMRGFSDEWNAVDNTPDISYGEDPAESLPTPSGSPAPTGLGEGSSSGEITADIQVREPTPSLLRDIDHRYSLHLLMYFTHWITVCLEQPHPRNSHMSETHARWIFTLLSRVDDYVTADEMSLLRNLARACMALLKDTVQDGVRGSAGSEVLETETLRMSERSCWFIIETVVDHWAQKDLWQDVESMLSEVTLE